MSRRPTLWQYVSFSRPSSRYSDRTELPLQNSFKEDMYEKPERRSGVYSPPSYKPAWKTQGTRSRYLKFGAAIAVVLLVFYILVPSERAKIKATKITESAHAVPTSLSTPQEAKSGTTKCSKPHDPSKQLMQYALMVDAGSTGSRIHVYSFNNCGPTPELEDEVFKMTEKKKGGSGLSSYDADAEGAAASLDVLLDTAVESVPKEYQSCSPIAVKATAGLRKLGTEKSEKILQAVRHRLETKYPFPVLSAEKGGVEVMDGKDEGVYAWITTNYLLGKIGSADKTPTAAVFDLGGGSTQIVFEPTFPKAADGGMPQTLEVGDHRYELSFGGRNFTLYQHSYLGYGLMAARENLHQVVVTDAYDAAQTAKQDGKTGWTGSEPLENPCVQPGQSVKVDVPLPESHPLGSTIKVEMTGPSTASAKSCLALAEKTLHKEAECKLAPCAFHGVYQPSLAQTFQREEIYLFSYFYDRLSVLGLPETLTLEKLEEVTADVCAGEASGKWKQFNTEALDELKERAEFCLDLNFQLALLTRGYEMKLEREVRIAKKINDRELG